MKPFVINGDVWRVVSVPPGDPSLIDRTGSLRIATTDPNEKVINISSNILPPLLDKVILHEVAHAITVSYKLLDPLRLVIPKDLWVLVEEWSVELVENFGIEAIVVASEYLGRPLCIRQHCI